MGAGAGAEGTTEPTQVAETVDELRQALADDAAFERWYRGALPRVFGYLVSRTGGDLELSEDLTQQAFIAAIDNRAGFDNRSDSTTWLCGIARHKLADHFRTRGRDDRRRMQMEVREIELAAGQDTARLDIGEREQIEQVLAGLPEAQRAVLVFVALDGLSVAEAGRLIGKSPLAAQSLLHRARESFRRAYRGSDR
jgi:RNA polymerase sigma-70 factor (ECF subfamily)